MPHAKGMSSSCSQAITEQPENRIPMQLNLDKPAEQTAILRVQTTETGFRLQIGNSAHESSVILSASGITPWSPTRPEELEQRHFEQLALLEAEVIVLGTGNSLVFPDPLLTQALTNAQIGLEVMNTQAACRTYNVLLGDGRPVAAALLLP